MVLALPISHAPPLMRPACSTTTRLSMLPLHANKGRGDACVENNEPCRDGPNVHAVWSTIFSTWALLAPRWPVAYPLARRKRPLQSPMLPYY